MNLSEVAALTENEAREYLEKIRWAEGPVCPHCTSKEVTLLGGKSTTPGTYKCKAKECRKKFTVRVGTIFESSHITLRHWVMAFHLMCSSKKGISAHQIHRSIGVTYKTAWFMCHRIRHAMDQGSIAMTGEVEVDETYVGGKPRKNTGKKNFRGMGTEKTPVVVLG
ncbi:IS1595 family transposase [Anatilimnocola floriformis]|uniref:IS1595 family transposase n=1 Tax=Anatilimnocola floriformis TaxID=2948575 RepID=UPI0020C398B6|nr:IS1595 family transposase [Anatilimnocola floriformis]